MSKRTEPVSPAKEFERLIRDVAYRHPIWRVFSDFCEIAAIAFGNSIVPDPEQEKRYHEIHSNYNEGEQAIFPKLLALTAKALEDLSCDFLGERFMSLELSSHWHGQFFTPIHICQLMAKTMLDDRVKAKIEEQGFITVLEPACGAGAMVLGFASAMRDLGLDYQKHIHVTCIDVDPTAANMCFIQLALHHIPAAVYTGNTLTMEMRSVRYTPAHHLGFWASKLSRTGVETTGAEEQEPSKTHHAEIILPESSQYQLFDIDVRPQKRAA